MGWFDEQLKQRIQADDRDFEDSFIQMAGVVMGRKAAVDLNDDTKRTRDAIEEILRFYHVKATEAPEEIKEMNEQLEYLMRPAGIMRRTVELTGSWYKDGIGALLASRSEDGAVVALIPNGLSGYSFFDDKSGKRVRVTRKNAKLFSGEAICFYNPLPLKKIKIPDLLKYVLQTLSPADFVMVGLVTMVVTFIGMLAPKINNIIFSHVIEGGTMTLFFASAALLVSVTVSTLLLSTAKSIIMTRLQTKMTLAVQSASMMRVMSLPAEFFKEYSAGELSSRTQSIGSLCNMLTNAILSTGLTSLFSLVYITQIFAYAPMLVVPALGVIVATVLFSIISAIVQMKIAQKTMEESAKKDGMTYALISGVQKIKLSGAEKRAFTRWSVLYKGIAKLLYDPPTFIKLNQVISVGITLGGTIVMYYFAVISGVSVADYYAFNTAYGMVMGAFMSLSGIALTVATIGPVLKMAKPILETVPEISAGKKVLTRITGGIELNNVSFRYSEDSPLILDNLSLKIRPGQYVAIVGKTGCGKSTLMRLLLGFEAPQKGAVYYDGKDLNSIDLKSLRRRIGVVMQNGKLFQGDIYSNITISAPWLTMDEAWEAAELSGIAEDIRAMPMGMHTQISEGSGGVSGGQRQRLMIARAIAPKPRILMFDEATSALDNTTQKQVSNSVDALKCTRIVIAHRLSTIKQCDRIIVLDKGRIIEDGSYEKLIQDKGYFAELVARQRLDDTEFVGKTTMF